MKQVKFAKIRARMVELGYTQATLSEKLGTSAQTLNAKLSGRVEFTVGEASELARILGLEDPANIFFNLNLHKTQEKEG